VYTEDAMAAAEAADKALASGHRIGPFHGIPFGLKDICDLQGRITTGGSMAMKARVSERTGTLTRRLLADGGIVLGKTKTVECAFGGWGTNQQMGTPWNPWDRQTHRVPGGSSAGSAAALAAGMALCAVGTDTGGSVRLPAGFCGLAGLKVTEGRLPTDGILPLSHTLDTPGPMARSVLDALIMFDVMDGREGWQMDRNRETSAGWYGQLTRGVAGLRLASLGESERDACDAQTLAAYDSAINTLSELGAHTEPLRIDRSYADMTFNNGKLIASEGFAHHGHLYDDPSLPMDEDVRPRMLGGKSVSASEYIHILQDRRVAQAEFLQAMNGFDAVLTPTSKTVAPPVANVDQNETPGHFTRPFNYLGMCGLSVPCGLSTEGMPFGLQIVGRGNDEAVCLRIGAAFEAAQPPVDWPA
jgi:aspartyl-tRNA(Asn)/glutamyl-tRNA(Gln) amidotransferase subunit A